MDYQTIISTKELAARLGDPGLAVMDCRYYLAEPERGYEEYLEAHIPGAIYIHMDRDLSGEIIPGKTGRHPLPDVTTFTERLSCWGIDETVQVVAYDNTGGGMAARLWWMLRWLGHDRVAVLDGDWRAWERENLPVEGGKNSRDRKEFHPRQHPEYLVDSDFVDQIREDDDFLLLDARSAERYWGLKEPIDRKSGHIPGAVTAPFALNLDEEGYFLGREELKARYEDLLNGLPTEQVVVYCGSGVTSNHNLIAMVEAGLGMARLYAGSWSEWITDPDRAVAP
ncbi:MAG: sulfurtransferase [Anaerolineales bacterium]|jgi:thiosulfate/3-mercaptopyruvate sulfurtransferase